MNLRIEPYNEDHVEAIEAFNRRLSEGGSEYQFPAKAGSGESGKEREYYLALDGKTVRGGYSLRRRDFRIAQKDDLIALMQPAITEKLIDRSFMDIERKLLEDAVEREPLLLVTGIESQNDSMAGLLEEMQWFLHEIEFYFKICHAFKFLRNIRYLRKNIFKRLVFDLGALSGLGWLGLKILNLFKFRKTLRIEDSKSEMVDAFGQWADDLWRVSRNGYIMSSLRDSQILNMLYPSSDQNYIRLRVFFGKNSVGWAVLLAIQLEDHKSYGNMKLGVIVDCLALPGFEEYVIEESTRVLKTLDVDLIAANQSYKSWRRAMKNCGYMRGPSNYSIAISPQLGSLLEPLQNNLDLIHINRADRSF